MKILFLLAAIAFSGCSQNKLVRSNSISTGNLEYRVGRTVFSLNSAQGLLQKQFQSIRNAKVLNELIDENLTFVIRNWR